VFRGWLVFAEVFLAESKIDKANQAIQKLTNRPVRTLVFLLILVVLINIGLFYCLWIGFR